MDPFFSIIVPVYNTENYIERCVESLLEQTCSDLEIILVDDGSTDSSGMLCDGFSQKNSRVRVVHKENAGLALARNTGLEMARGSYVSFVDSDDWMEQDSYQVIRESLEKDAPDILNFGYQKVSGNQVLMREHSTFTEGVYDILQIRNTVLPDSIARRKAFDQVNLPVQLSACMCVYRRDFLQKNGILFVSERDVLCEDWLFNISCLCRADRMVILHDIFYNYFTRENSTSMSYKSDSYFRRKNLYRHYCDELKKTQNDTEENLTRLRNFWMESVYCCYIIECGAPGWNCEVRNRMDTLSCDPLLLEYSRKLNLRNCTPKGIVFIIITRLKLHHPFWTAYRKLKGYGR